MDKIELFYKVNKLKQSVTNNKTYKKFYRFTFIKLHLFKKSNKIVYELYIILFLYLLHIIMKSSKNTTIISYFIKKNGFCPLIYFSSRTLRDPNPMR
jgi:hypothetical protein